ncbi:MAG TPA: 2,5-diamino-6-(ribosylamino)-4(3H)-pyrimidinone 5'-phosphate reductase [Anaerolineae bacterium]|nr:2,5-diamino-6-(ribosylamino)-4(3H)-pyrimidinone 5'-phosphate reductase [Anaerolineae bacterium]
MIWNYNKRVTRPFVFINVAMTADGKIDTFARKGAGISSQRDKDRVDRLRAESDAVMVGGRTLLDEDPKLTVKSEALREERIARGLAPNPIKVGVVSEAKLKTHSKFLQEGGARIVIFTTQRTSKEELASLREQNVEVFVHDGERVNLSEMMQALQGLGIKRLMVEGGGTLNFELIRLGLVDEVSAYVAPMIFGGEKAPTMAAGVGLERIEAVPLKLIHVENWDEGGVLLHYKLERSK